MNSWTQRFLHWVTEMRGRLWISMMVVAAVCLCDITFASPVVRENQPQIRPQVTFFQAESGYKSLLISLRNASSHMLCISGLSFNPTLNFIRIWDNHERPVTSRVAGLPTERDYRGFNFGQSYDFLPSGKMSSFTVDLKDFPLAPGPYRYKLETIYYVCRDIIDLEKVSARAAQRYTTVSSGRFVVPRLTQKPDR